MFIDVAMPSGNEEEFISMAEKLGTDGLVFLYRKADKKSLERVKKLDSKGFRVFSGLIVKDKIAGKGHDYLFSNGLRSHFENKNVDVIYGLESAAKKDSHHYRKSGLNHVLCGLAKENNIALGFSFGSVLKSADPMKIIGRMAQNIKLCRKYKNRVLIASFAEKPNELKFSRDLISFGAVIGLTLIDAKKAVLNRKV